MYCIFLSILRWVSNLLVSGNTAKGTTDTRLFSLNEYSFLWPYRQSRPVILHASTDFKSLFQNSVEELSLSLSFIGYFEFLQVLDRLFSVLFLLVNGDGKYRHARLTCVRYFIVFNHNHDSYLFNPHNYETT